MRGRCFKAGLGVLVIGLGERVIELGGRYIGPDGEVILAVGVRLAHLEGGRWLAGRAGREKLFLGFAGDNSAGFAWTETLQDACQCLRVRLNLLIKLLMQHLIK